MEIGGNLLGCVMQSMGKQRMQRNSKHTTETKECSGMRGCRGLGAKVATQVPLPLLFLKTEIHMARLACQCDV